MYIANHSQKHLKLRPLHNQLLFHHANAISRNLHYKRQDKRRMETKAYCILSFHTGFHLLSAVIPSRSKNYNISYKIPCFYNIMAILL